MDNMDSNQMSSAKESPSPFRRERNHSNRNFNRKSTGSRRRFSTESHSSMDSTASLSGSVSTDIVANATTAAAINNNSSNNDLSSSLQISYSVNSDTENAFNRKSLRKLRPLRHIQQTVSLDEPAHDVTSSADPALLDVKQKVQHFETLQSEDRILFKTGKYRTQLKKMADGNAENHRVRVLPTTLARKQAFGIGDAGKVLADVSSTHSTSLHASIHEECSADEVDDISDYEADADDNSEHEADADDNSEDEADYELPEEAEELLESDALVELPGLNNFESNDLNFNAIELTEPDFKKVETVNSSVVYQLKNNSNKQSSVTNAQTQALDNSNSSEETTSDAKKGVKDFPRNFRTVPRQSRPKTEIAKTKTRQPVGKQYSLYVPNEADVEAPVEDEIELRNKWHKFIQPILDELIKTEETYVDNLLLGIENYGNIFERKDLPMGLRGKKYVLLGNIQQIAEFHRDEFLPMLHRNQRDLKRLFDEFQELIDQNCFYGYVIFTMNKQRSLKLCDVYKNYFKLIQTDLDDKLGINSFLVQPIQRMARYPLLLKQFMETLFKHHEFVMKPIIESCCRLDKKVRNLLTTTNESEVINDIVDCHEFNVFYQGKFRKVSDFHVFDHTLKRSYRSKVFIFDKCIIYTEIKGKNLIFRGRYPCEHIGISAKPKTFTLYYQKRKQQECDFSADQATIDLWQTLLTEMVTAFITEEKIKLQEMFSRKNDHKHPVSLQLYRDSNRFSSDSGIGNIWVYPKPEADSESVGNRTTWYALS